MNNAPMGEISADTTTFHVIEPDRTAELSHIPTLSATPSMQRLNRRNATKIDITIQEFIKLKGMLYEMNVRANMLPPDDPDHLDYADASHIRQWMDGVDTEVKKLQQKRAVYMFNAGEPAQTVPPAVGDLTPDFDVRALSMKDAGKSDDDIAKDRIYLGKLDGYGTLKSETTR